MSELVYIPHPMDIEVRKTKGAVTHISELREVAYLKSNFPFPIPAKKGEEPKNLDKMKVKFGIGDELGLSLVYYNSENASVAVCKKSYSVMMTDGEPKEIESLYKKALNNFPYLMLGVFYKDTDTQLSVTHIPENHKRCPLALTLNTTHLKAGVKPASDKILNTNEYDLLLSDYWGMVIDQLSKPNSFLLESETDNIYLAMVVNENFIHQAYTVAKSKYSQEEYSKLHLKENLLVEFSVIEESNLPNNVVFCRMEAKDCLELSGKEKKSYRNQINKIQKLIEDKKLRVEILDKPLSEKQSEEIAELRVSWSKGREVTFFSLFNSLSTQNLSKVSDRPYLNILVYDENDNLVSYSYTFQITKKSVCLYEGCASIGAIQAYLNWLECKYWSDKLGEDILVYTGGFDPTKDYGMRLLKEKKTLGSVTILDLKNIKEKAKEATQGNLMQSAGEFEYGVDYRFYDYEESIYYGGSQGLCKTIIDDFIIYYRQAGRAKLRVDYRLPLPTKKGQTIEQALAVVKKILSESKGFKLSTEVFDETIVSAIKSDKDFVVKKDLMTPLAIFPDTIDFELKGKDWSKWRNQINNANKLISENRIQVGRDIDSELLFKHKKEWEAEYHKVNGTSVNKRKNAEQSIEALKNRDAISVMCFDNNKDILFSTILQVEVFPDGSVVTVDATFNNTETKCGKLGSLACRYIQLKAIKDYCEANKLIWRYHLCGSEMFGSLKDFKIRSGATAFDTLVVSLKDEFYKI